jgi:hypothetical protein
MRNENNEVGRMQSSNAAINYIRTVVTHDITAIATLACIIIITACIIIYLIKRVKTKLLGQRRQDIQVRIRTEQNDNAYRLV